MPNVIRCRLFTFNTICLQRSYTDLLFVLSLSLVDSPLQFNNFNSFVQILSFTKIHFASIPGVSLVSVFGRPFNDTHLLWLILFNSNVSCSSFIINLFFSSGSVTYTINAWLLFFLIIFFFLLDSGTLTRCVTLFNIIINSMCLL